LKGSGKKIILSEGGPTYSLPKGEEGEPVKSRDKNGYGRLRREGLSEKET